jgi:hypothetical protein
MTRHHHRIFGLLASIVAAAALVAPAEGAGSPEPSNATLRNDVAHHGRQSSPEAPNASLRNDIAHNGTTRVLPTQESPAPIVVRVDGGFDWISAGVGAAGGFGLLLVAGAAMSTLRRRHDIDPAGA